MLSHEDVKRLEVIRDEYIEAARNGNNGPDYDKLDKANYITTLMTRIDMLLIMNEE